MTILKHRRDGPPSAVEAARGGRRRSRSRRAVLCAAAAGATASPSHLRAHAVTTVKIVSDLPLTAATASRRCRWSTRSASCSSSRATRPGSTASASRRTTTRPRPGGVGRGSLHPQRALVRGRPDDRRRDRHLQLGLRGARDPDPEQRRTGDGQPREHVPRAHQDGDRQRLRRARGLLPGRRAQLHARRPFRRQRGSHRRDVHEARAARDEGLRAQRPQRLRPPDGDDVRGRGEAARPPHRGPRRLGPGPQELRRPDDADQGDRRRRALHRRRLRPQRRPSAPATRCPCSAPTPG